MDAKVLFPSEYLSKLKTTNDMVPLYKSGDDETTVGFVLITREEAVVLISSEFTEEKELVAKNLVEIYFGIDYDAENDTYEVLSASLIPKQ